jgi:predicted enzyme related to lactoylglutathione lyase
MKLSHIGIGAACVVSLVIMSAATRYQPESDMKQEVTEPETIDLATPSSEGMTVKYLEIVTPMVDETCEALSNAHGVDFGEPIAEFGNARTAELTSGGRIGVRAPMRTTEEPVVRPYILVDDIEASVKAAEEAGATIALPPMKIPGQGMFSIYILGGIEHGLWQN